jgi:uncharacterized delta-60 repeat protein
MIPAGCSGRMAVGVRRTARVTFHDVRHAASLANTDVDRMTPMEKAAQRRPAAIALGCIALGLCAMAAASGDPDPAFGSNGQVMIARPDAFALANAWIGDIATLPDGRVLWVMEDGADRAWVMRLLPDGTPDSGFGTDGRVVIDSCVRARPMRLVADADGGAVVWTGACLLRIDAHGDIDTAFGVGGSFPPSPTPLAFRAAELLRDSQGRWLLAGVDADQWRVHRYLADGSDDAAFGIDGVATAVVGAGSSSRELHAMAVRGDDRIVLAGSYVAGSLRHLVLAQLDAVGMPDPDFGSNGVVDLPPPVGYQGLNGLALAIDLDGTTVVGGEARNGMVGCCVMVARVDETGVPMPGSPRIFAPAPGVSLSPFGETSTTVALLPGRRILLARNTFPPFQPPLNTRTRFTLVRMDADGSLDTSFGDAGWRTYIVDDPTGTGIDGAYTQIHGMSYASGKAVMFGRTFFEDEAMAPSYVTLQRAVFDRLFTDGFDR